MCFTSQIGYFTDQRYTNYAFTIILKYIQIVYIFVYGEFHRALPVTVANYFVNRPQICVLPPRLGILQTRGILITP